MFNPIQTPPLGRILAVLIAAGLFLAGCQKPPEATALPVKPEKPPAAQASAGTNGSPSPTAAAIPMDTGSAGVAAGSTAATPAPVETSPASSYPVGTVAAPAGKVIMPILLYHHISDKGGSYVVKVENFRAQMETLKQEGYESVTVSQITDAIRSGGPLPAKPVAITFDDGYLDIYENAYPILKEMGYSATVYVITGTLGTELSYGYMQAEQLKELSSAGWEIGSHGVTHTDLKKTKLGAGNEMSQSKQTLEEQLGIQVRSFSFPFASANPSLKELAAQEGYDSAVGIDVYNTHTPKSLYFLSRREVDRSTPLFGLKKLLEPGKVDHVMATQSAAETPAP